MTTREFTADRSGERLDLFLARQDLGLTRSQVQRLLQEGHALLNRLPARAGQRLKAGDRVWVHIPPAQPVEVQAEAIPVPVLYQDEYLLVVDKPAGLPVHPSPGHPSHTLVNALLALCPGLKGIGGELRPGIVHRLDKDTSGLMVVAKSHGVHLALSQAFKERWVKKGYLALVTGRVALDSGVIDAPIGRDPRHRKRMAVVPGGREARTRFRVLRRLQAYTLVEVFPETGRTHQIRVHLASMGHPLVGDALYGRKAAHLVGRQFLHAHFLAFHHPVTGQWLEFTSALPEDLERALAALG